MAYPTPYPAPTGPAGAVGSSSLAPVFNPVVPYIQHMGPLYPNKMIIISGIPKLNPTRFSVFIQQGNSQQPHEIAMTFDARFAYGNDRNVVVRNHKQGNWGSEERHINYFPFAADAFFEMVILVQPYSFKVAVNNQHVVEFNHRLQPLQRFDTLRITGDIRLTQVKFQG